jgi:hypothetical protein
MTYNEATAGTVRRIVAKDIVGRGQRPEAPRLELEHH